MYSVIAGYQTVYKITVKHQQVRIPISLKSGSFLLKFSEILHAYAKTNRSRASGAALISIPGTK